MTGSAYCAAVQRSVDYASLIHPTRYALNRHQRVGPPITSVALGSRLFGLIEAETCDPEAVGDLPHCSFRRQAMSYRVRIGTHERY